ncbi:uncharacterized protein LOC124481178 [Hypomesus transpacificus]|uniref:uncharacterized protein LOC124481178 n=1 Tax=Hypomesus transpacificus TaxID=137520 RepID=UPI001F073C86|nr:uncharacterized protein LOC124481178 [Hypomesus transpacificus]
MGLFATMFSTAKKYLNNRGNVPPRFPLLDLDVGPLRYGVVCLLVLILLQLWSLHLHRKRRKQAEDEGYEEIDLDLLNDATSHTVTLYSSCVDCLEELLEMYLLDQEENEQEYSDTLAKCGSFYSRDEGSSCCCCTSVNPDTCSDNESYSCYSQHVQGPSNCKQQKSIHLCNNSGGRCLDVKMNSQESNSDSESIIDTFTSLPSLSSLKSSQTSAVSVKSRLREMDHIPHEVLYGKQVSTDKLTNDMGISKVNQPLSHLIDEDQSMKRNLRRIFIRRLWRRAILMVRIINMLLPNRLKRETKQRRPDGDVTLHTERQAQLVSHSATGPDQVDSFIISFQSKRAMFEPKVILTAPEMTLGRIPRNYITHKSWRPKISTQERKVTSNVIFRSVLMCPFPTKGLANESEPPKSRSFVVYQLGIKMADLLEMTVRQNHLQQLLGVSTLYSDSLAKLEAEKVLLGSRPSFLLSFRGVKTPFIPQEHRDKLESHVKLKVIQHSWGLPKLVSHSTRGFMAQAPKLKQVDKIHNRRNSVENNSQIYHLSQVADQLSDQLNKSKSSDQATSTSTEETKKIFWPEMTRDMAIDSFNEGQLCKFDKLKDTSWHDLMKKRCTTSIKINPETPLKRNYLEITLASPKSNVKNVIEVLDSISRVKPILFMKKETLDLIEINLKQKHLENLLGPHTLFHKSMDLIKPEASLQKILQETPLPSPKVQLVSSETPFPSKEIRDKLEFHIKCKKIQQLLGLSQVVQKSTNAVLSKECKTDLSKAVPKPQYEIKVMTSKLAFLTEAQKEALERNVREKKAHKSWGSTKRVLQSPRTFELPKGVAKDLRKRCQPRAEPQPFSRVSKEAPTEIINFHTSSSLDEFNQPEASDCKTNQNNSNSFSSLTTTLNEKRGFGNVSFGPVIQSCLVSDSILDNRASLPLPPDGWPEMAASYVHHPGLKEE